MQRRWAAGLSLGLLIAPAAWAEPVRRAPCPADAPPGIRFPDRPECRERPALRRAEPGFIDLGGGTSIRVGGRVRGEVETRR